MEPLHRVALIEPLSTAPPVWQESPTPEALLAFLSLEATRRRLVPVHDADQLLLDDQGRTRLGRYRLSPEALVDLLSAADSGLVRSLALVPSREDRLLIYNTVLSRVWRARHGWQGLLEGERLFTAFLRPLARLGSHAELASLLTADSQGILPRVHYRAGLLGLFTLPGGYPPGAGLYLRSQEGAHSTLRVGLAWNLLPDFPLPERPDQVGAAPLTAWCRAPALEAGVFRSRRAYRATLDRQLVALRERVLGKPWGEESYPAERLFRPLGFPQGSPWLRPVAAKAFQGGVRALWKRLRQRRLSGLWAGPVLERAGGGDWSRIGHGQLAAALASLGNEHRERDVGEELERLAWDTIAGGFTVTIPAA